MGTCINSDSKTLDHLSLYCLLIVVFLLSDPTVHAAGPSGTVVLNAQLFIEKISAGE